MPKYTCISYSWGKQRVPHPFAPEHLVSARALPVLEATIRARAPESLWLDALCVPFEESARAATLRNMGAIYAGAERVVVVLSSACAPAIRQIKAAGAIDGAALVRLATDDWVTRAWTYQECANSVDLRFCAQGEPGVSVGGVDVLNALGKALADYRRDQQTDAFEVRSVLPALDGLEDALAEWMMGGVAERTAYQVMAAIELRSPETSAADRLNAMVGAVAPEFAGTHVAAEAHPACLFMQACEQKGDYSFIYAAGERSTTPGRTWQPAPGRLTPILSWHSSGAGQHGQLYADRLELDSMAHVSPGTLGQEAAEYIARWLNQGSVANTAGLVGAALSRLRKMGFSGSGEYVELEQGLFFPQRRTPPDSATILIATGIQWVHGAPALAVLPREADMFSFGDVGVFVGPIPGEQVSVSIQ
jgi:hypothetical protein